MADPSPPRRGDTVALDPDLDPDPVLAPGAPLGPLRRPGLLVALGAVVVIGLSVLSVFVGSGDITAREVVQALRYGGDDPTSLIIRDFRLPRAFLAIATGAALGVAGALMQAVTRNPLADPGILGVNAGAYSAVVFAAAFLGSTIGFAHVLVSLVGAFVATVVVYLVGSAGRAGGSPARLLLAGVALAAVFQGVSFAVTLLRPEVFDRVRFWSAGSLQGRGFDDLWTVLPFLVVGLVVALVLPRSLNTLGLGDDTAAALGARPALVRVVAIGAVTVLCGAATAAVGPISFVGLIVPHAVRSLVGPDWRRVVPVSAVVAPVLMLGADILGRVMISSELPAGVVTAVIGAPVLVALVRRRGAAAL